MPVKEHCCEDMKDYIRDKHVFFDGDHYSFRGQTTFKNGAVCFPEIVVIFCPICGVNLIESI